MSAEILIIDDNSEIREILNDLIKESGYSTRIAANYKQALMEIDKKLPDVAIIDVKLDKSDNDGIELLLHIKNKNRNIPVIIISGHANIDMAIKSLKSGAFEFIQKPFDQQRLMNFIKRAVENLKLKIENEKLQNKLFHTFDLIGVSQNILSIKDQIEKVSYSDSRVFISGPTGTGKELIARKIYKNSEEISLTGRASSLKRCFENVINNGLIYGEKVYVSIHKSSNRIIINIEDNGPGIAEDQYRNVFKPFFRLDKSRSLNQSGVGLGLAIVEDIINSHGGNIQLGKSKYNGLQVKISLPF